jgi:hypothetical protein
VKINSKNRWHEKNEKKKTEYLKKQIRLKKKENRDGPDGVKKKPDAE